MLNVWIALMFGSGIPFLYIAVFLVFVIQDLVDRQDLIKFCTQPVRYGPRLPRLVLGKHLRLRLHLLIEVPCAARRMHRRSLACRCRSSAASDTGATNFTLTYPPH
jgi:hypothetical protein